MVRHPFCLKYLHGTFTSAWAKIDLPYGHEITPMKCSPAGLDAILIKQLILGKLASSILDCW